MSEGKKRSERQEKRTADQYKGSRNAMSGAGWLRKADVRTEELLFESKTTKNKSFSLKLSDLRQLRLYAIQDDRIPVFQIEFEESPGRRHSYVVLDEHDFKEMLREHDNS